MWTSKHKCDIQITNVTFKTQMWNFKSKCVFQKTNVSFTIQMWTSKHKCELKAVFEPDPFGLPACPRPAALHTTLTTTPFLSPGSSWKSIFSPMSYATGTGETRLGELPLSLWRNSFKNRTWPMQWCLHYCNIAPVPTSPQLKIGEPSLPPG